MNSGPNPIVDLALRLRARKELDEGIEAGARGAGAPPAAGLESRLRAFADGLAGGITRLNAILGRRNGATLVTLERPFRITVRFGEKRVSVKPLPDGEHVQVSGAAWAGEYAFEPSTNALFPRAWFEGSSPAEPSPSPEDEPLTPSSLLRELTRDAMLPPPSQPGGGPLPL